MADISFDHVTESLISPEGEYSTNTLTGKGHFDVLMKALRAHISEAVDNNEITQEIAGQVYTGVIPSLVTEAVKFELGADMVNIQIDNEKAKNSALMAETLAKLDKEMGYESAQLIDGEIVLGAPDEGGLVDKQIAESVANELLTQEKIESEDFQNRPDGVLANQIFKVKADIDATEAQTSSVLAEMLAKLDKELGFTGSTIVDGKIVLGTPDTDGLIDKQIAESIANELLTQEKIESEDYQNKTDGVLDNSIKKIKEDIEIAKNQVALERAKAIAAIDKEYGYEYEIDSNNNIVIGDDAGDGKLDEEVAKLENENRILSNKT
jgi:hypothetical protein